MKRISWLLGALALSCGGRPEAWDEPFEPGAVVGLQTSVAVLDPRLDRVVFLESPSHLGLRSTVLPVGKQAVKVVPSPKNDRLFVLSKGVQPRRKTSDEAPSLTVFGSTPNPAVEHRWELDDAFSGLSLDPEGRWAIVHTGEGVVENPNELILVDVENTSGEEHIKSIRSFGGRPVGFTFTSELAIRDVEPRRVLLVSTEQDLALVDLADIEAPEITVKTPLTEQLRPSIPDKIVFHDADGDSDPVIAVSFVNNVGVLLMNLVAADADAAQAFTPQINTIVDVGGKPSAVDFVKTEDGLRLAAIVPSAQHAALVDPRTAAVDFVPMPVPFTGITRVTGSFDDSPDADVALLWTSSVGRVGIWRLDTAIGAPYASIETFDIGVGVSRVIEVPGPNQGACPDEERCFDQYKIVAGTGPQDFYLLDLDRKQASLMVTNGRDLSLSVSPDGERLWAFTPDDTGFAQVSFANLHPISLSVQAPILGVFDVGRPNMAADGGNRARSSIVLHAGSGLAATVFDALEPDDAVTRFYQGLAYGGLAR